MAKGLTSIEQLSLLAHQRALQHLSHSYTDGYQTDGYIFRGIFWFSILLSDDNPLQL